MERNENRPFWSRTVVATFAIIICMPVVLFAIPLISGIFVIAYEDELYAKDLNNPYVNSNFEGWHTVEVELRTMILPKDWELSVEREAMHISKNGKIIALGMQIDGHDSSQTEKLFLTQVLETTITETDCVNVHSLLGSSFGKLYINKNKQLQGYYLKLVNGDEPSLLFYFPAVENTESELVSIAEAIIYYNKFLAQR